VRVCACVSVCVHVCVCMCVRARGIGVRAPIKREEEGSICVLVVA